MNFHHSNLIVKNWSSKFTNDLTSCKLLIVPSLCDENYGRVAREKFIIGGKVLVSNIGGLPETVDFKINI